MSETPISYTAKTGTREALLTALKDLEPGTFEVVIQPEDSINGPNDYTLRTEDVEGAIHAINDLAPGMKYAVVRVFEVGA